MPSQSEIRRQITDKIIDGLFFGVVPWKKPWRNHPNSGAPANVISRRNYSGINPLLLDLVAMSRGFQSKWWGTYQQWASLGANVRKRPADVDPGHWGTNIIFYKQVEKKTKANEQDEKKNETFPMLRYFTVFNIDQVEGSAVDHLRASFDGSNSSVDPNFEAAEKAIAATNADIRFGGNRACYTRPIGLFPNHTDGDYISMPCKEQFESAQEFYATSLHELVHWSEIRRSWTGSYAMGELVAEIGACFACAEVGIPCSDNLDNHVAYLDLWLKMLKDDDRAIFKAASEAAKAAEFILRFSRPKEPIPEELQTA